MIQIEGKHNFCKAFLDDLKQLRKENRVNLKSKRLLMKQMKRYCVQRSPAKDRKFLASLDKMVRKEKKKMDAQLKKIDDYYKVVHDGNLYKSLNDTGFLTSLRTFMQKGTENTYTEPEPVNDDDETSSTTTEAHTTEDKNKDDYNYGT